MRFWSTSLCLLLTLCALQAADLFDGKGALKSAVTKDNLDTAKSIANPGNAPVRPGVVRAISKGHHYAWKASPTKAAEPTEFIVRLKQPTDIGTLLYLGDFQASYLPADSTTGKWLQFKYPGDQHRQLRVTPLTNVEKVAAIKLSAPAGFDKQGKPAKSLGLAAPLAGRYVNIAPEAELRVSSSSIPKDGFRPDPRQTNPETLLDGKVAHRNWSSVQRKDAISPEKPEWVVLDWHSPKTIRSCIFMMGSSDSGFGEVIIQKYVGSDNLDETDDSQWETVTEAKGYHRWRPPQCWEVVADFGQDLTTRAVRFVFTSGLHQDQAAGKEGANDKQIAMGEIVVLQDLHDQPAPARITRRKSLPDGVVPITFTMPEAGKASIRIRNKNGEVIKNLINGESFPAGEQTVYWDLSNLEDYWYPFEPSKHEYRPPANARKIALPGDYSWEGLWHPDYELKYKYSYYPLKKHGMAWITSDTTGGWLADHAPPKTVIRTGNTMWVGTFCEAGNALLEADLDMKKLMGSGRIWLACPKILAYDNGKIYYLEQGGWAKKIIMIEVDVKTKQSRRLLGRDFKKNEKVEFAGLVVKGDRAHITDRLNDKLIVLDISKNLAARPQGFGWDRVYKLADHEKMNVIKEVALPKPGRLRPYDDQHLIAVSDKSVVLINTEDFSVKPLITGLINPIGLAWDPKQKEIYVGEMKPVHQVKVFNPEGKLLRTIGKPGPHQLSTEIKLFDHDNLESPLGLDVDANGNLWVCEANSELKRTSVWNRDGKCVNEVTGPTVYGGGGDVDPRNPNRTFYAGKEFLRDPATGKFELVRLIWRGSQNMKFTGPKAHNFGGMAPAYPFYNGDKLFFTMWQGWAMGSFNCIYAYEDGQAKPVAAIGTTTELIYDTLGIEHVADNRFGHNVLVRNDKNIDFDWKSGSPDPKVDKDRFAVRWTGDLVVPETGDYTFFLNANDVMRLDIDGERILGNWHWDRKRHIRERKIKLTKGRHPLILDYYEERGGAHIKLEWTGPGIEKQVVPASAFRIDSTPDAKPGLRGAYFNSGRKDSIFTWTDLNADGKMQKSEIKTKTYKSDQGPCSGAGGQWQFKVNKNFQAAACTYGGGKRQLLFFTPKGKTDKGYPIYDLPDQLYPFPGTEVSALMVDEKGNAIILSNYVYSISPQGKVNWRYIDRWPSLHAGHRTSATGKEPGVLIATTRFFGAAPLNNDIGELISISSNLGASYLFTADGFYLDQIFRDIRTGLSWRCNEPPSKELLKKLSLGDEHFGGTFQRSVGQDGEHYQYVAGQPHCSVIEISGLQKTKRLPGGKVEVTSKDLVAADKLRQLRALKKAVKKTYNVQVNDQVKIDGKADEWPKERIDGFALAYDDKNLYVLFSGRDWRAPFKNAANDNFMEAFKTGDMVDVMLQTLAGANPKRENGEHGDIRLSFTQINGKPAAILYDFVVPGTSKDKRCSFSSPWRTFYIDRVRLLPSAQIVVKRKGDRYTLEAAVPLKDIHFDPKTTSKVRGDVGRVLSDQTGTRAVDRVYWSNKNTKIMADVPSEARVQPNLWGEFEFVPKK